MSHLIVPTRALTRMSAAIIAAFLLLSSTGVVAQATSAVATLTVSSSPSRGSAAPLDGAKVGGDIYVELRSSTTFREVAFRVDSNTAHIERDAPYDLAGGSKASANPYDTTKLTDGDHKLTATITRKDGSRIALTGRFLVDNNQLDLNWSTAPNRSNARSLTDATIADNVYIFAKPSTPAKEVAFYLDGASIPVHTERDAPYDLAGGSTAAAKPLDTRTLASGDHELTTLATLADGRRIKSVDAFRVENAAQAEPAPNPSDEPATDLTDEAPTVTWSSQAERAPSQPLEGATIAGKAYITANPSAPVELISFYLDNAATPVHTERDAPYDLAGGSLATANPLDTATLSEGPHTLTTVAALSDGREVKGVTSFEVASRGQTETSAPKPGDGDAGGLQPSGRSGLHFTATELELWRHRAHSGPYKSKGDAGTNTPGDWDRISSNTQRFVAAPSAGLWNGPSITGCIEQHDEKPPRDESTNLRDAAFYSLVKDDPKVRAAVAQRLLAQARMKGVDYTNTARWCSGKVFDVGPNFAIAHWMTQHLFAYDYVGRDYFTPQEQALLDNWFHAGARVHYEDTEYALSTLFVNRNADDYRPRVAAGFSGTAYDGSKPLSKIARAYNNRRASQMRYVALTGIFLDDNAYKASSKRFVKEYIKYAVYPEGFTGDFNRWTSSDEEKGWTYAASLAAHVITIADAFARDGDGELYNYVTSEGIYGSEGGQKSLEFVMESLAKYVTGDFDRRAGGDRIDGVLNGRTFAHEVMLAHGNRYYDNARVESIITRSGGVRPWPSNPLPNGPNEAWQGDGGIFPGMLFMFGGSMAGTHPYPN